MSIRNAGKYPVTDVAAEVINLGYLDTLEKLPIEERRKVILNATTTINVGTMGKHTGAELYRLRSKPEISIVQLRI